MNIYIESKEISQGRKYRLKTDNINMPLICISGLFWKYIKIFNLNHEPNFVGNLELDPEVELSNRFCSVMNSELGENFFSVGCSEECHFPYLQARYNTKLKVEEELNKNVKLKDEQSERMAEEIERLKNDLDYPISDIFNQNSEGYKAINRIKSLQRKKDFYFYSKYIIYLMEQKRISSNHPLPLLFNKTIEEIGIDNYSSDGHEYVDLYPIDLALKSDNFQLLKTIIYNGGVKFSYNSHRYWNRLTDLILFILKNSKSEDDMSLVYSIFDLYPKDYEWIFKVNSSNPTYGPTRDNISSDGHMILREAYKTSLRINSTTALSTLLTKQRHWLMKTLQGLNIYAPKTIANEEDIKLSEEMIMFIKENIGKHLSEYKDYDPHEHGIWGYDAFSGAPIMYSDLKV